MAKKRPSRTINMAAEIRTLLKTSPGLSGRAVFEALTRKFPKQKINESSCSVAFSGARKKLGIVKKQKRKRGAKKTVVRKRAATVDLAALQAAAKFVSQIGDADKAIEAVRQIRLLQVG